MKIYILLIFMVMMGCAPQPTLVSPHNDGLTKATDLDRGVTCYKFRGWEGIHCFTERELK